MRNAEIPSRCPNYLMWLGCQMELLKLEAVQLSHAGQAITPISKFKYLDWKTFVFSLVI